MPALDAAREREQLERACESLTDKGLVTFDWVEQATLGEMLKHFNGSDYHIFHFIGHGDFDEQAEDGVLLFEGRAGRSQRITGADLGTILADQHTLRLAVINACEGARVALDSSGIAASLMRYGMPAVIAMQFEISDEAAIGFAEHFYESVARSHPIDEALADARRGMFAAGHGLEWATPVLFTSVDDGRLFEVGWDSAGSPTSSEPTPTPTPTPTPVPVPTPVPTPVPKPKPDPVPVGEQDDGCLPLWTAGAFAAVALLVVTVVVLLLAGAFSGSSGPIVGRAISVGRSPVGIAVGQGRVWVTGSDVGTLSSIDPTNDAVTKEATVEEDPNSVAVDPRGYVWVALLKAGQVAWFDPRLHKVVDQGEVGTDPNTIAVGMGAAWVANSGDGTVDSIDLHTHDLETVEGVGRHTGGIAVGLDYVWVTRSRAQTVVQIDPVMHTITKVIPVGRSAQGIAVGGGAVWVTNPLENTVSRIDPRSGKIKPIPVGRGPEGIAAASNGIWVANSSGSVSRIDPRSRKVVGKPIPVEGRLNAIAVGFGTVWVTNLFDSTVIPIKP
jgi:DNA-binding beta-propeller fold protein YncE